MNKFFCIRLDLILQDDTCNDDFIDRQCQVVSIGIILLTDFGITDGIAVPIRVRSKYSLSFNFIDFLENNTIGLYFLQLLTDRLGNRMTGVAFQLCDNGFNLRLLDPKGLNSLDVKIARCQRPCLIKDHLFEFG
ncbi:hypothetical protein D3C81_1787820 [compost metagenome]